MLFLLSKLGKLLYRLTVMMIHLISALIDIEICKASNNISYKILVIFESVTSKERKRERERERENFRMREGKYPTVFRCQSYHMTTSRTIWS